MLNLLKELQSELNLTLLFVAHNLAVVEHVSDRVAVMYLGKIVEFGAEHEIYERPSHPYTQALLSATPVADPARKRERIRLSGELPSPFDPPAGCAFHPRCPHADERCAREPPEMRGLESGAQVACHGVEEDRVPHISV